MHLLCSREASACVLGRALEQLYPPASKVKIGMSLDEDAD
jgi:hypothetical protein